MRADAPRPRSAALASALSSTPDASHLPLTGSPGRISPGAGFGQGRARPAGLKARGRQQASWPEGQGSVYKPFGGASQPKRLAARPRGPGTHGTTGDHHRTLRPSQRLAALRLRLATLHERLSQGAMAARMEAALHQQIADVDGQVSRLSALRGRLVQMLLG